MIKNEQVGDIIYFKSDLNNKMISYYTITEVGKDYIDNPEEFRVKLMEYGWHVLDRNRLLFHKKVSRKPHLPKFLL